MSVSVQRHQLTDASLLHHVLLVERRHLAGHEPAGRHDLFYFAELT